MQGVYVAFKRPKTKKALREAVKLDPARVTLERTSMFTDTEYDGPVSEAPEGEYTFVGPDPYINRRFYGRIVIRGGVIQVV